MCGFVFLSTFAAIFWAVPFTNTNLYAKKSGYRRVSRKSKDH